MYQIVFLDRGTFAENIEIPLLQIPHEWISYDKTPASLVLERSKQADFIVTNKVNFDKEILSQLPNLKHIAITATGTNCVDLVAAQKLGISVSNVPGYGTSSVAEHVFAMILALRRNLLPYHDDINQGKWQASEQFCFYNSPILDLSGSTLGLIGTGAIANKVATIAKAFGMQVIFHSVSGRKSLDGETLVPLDNLLRSADIVSLHCPLSAKTEKLINQEKLNVMRNNALLINTARGSLIDLDALQNTLEQHQIAGAGLDVAPIEPPSDDAVILKLNMMHNCIVTPHTAWASLQASKTLINQVIKNLEAAAHNTPLNWVT